MNVVCSSCGQNNEDHREYCWSCSSILKEREINVTNKTLEQPPQEFNIDLVVIHLFGLLCVIFGLIFASIGMLTALTIVLLPAGFLFLILAALLVLTGVGLWKFWPLAWYAGIFICLGLVINGLRMLQMPQSIIGVTPSPVALIFSILLGLIPLFFLIRRPNRQRFHKYPKQEG